MSANSSSNATAAAPGAGPAKTNTKGSSSSTYSKKGSVPVTARHFNNNNNPNHNKPKRERSTSSSSDTHGGPGSQACIVCYRDVKYYSVGNCEHPVCFECSARMRVLLGQNECPICRQTMTNVIFTRGKKSFSQLESKIRMFIMIPAYGLYLEDEEIKQAFDELLEHKCILCEDEPVFRNFNELSAHIRRTHDLYSCDLCVNHIKLFPKEIKFYTRGDLGYHKRKGDKNDKSHRGHPICEFCDKRYFDSDELYRHLRKDHYFCHFCDADGFNHYYNTYDDLRIHFRKEHFLCEEERCIDEKFTSVFRSEIDLKAHLASIHSKLLGKHGLKQARTLDIEFGYNNSRRENERGGASGRFGSGRGGSRGMGDRDRGDRERDSRYGRGQNRDRGDPTEVNQTPTEPPEPVQVPSIVVKPQIESVQDFPTLEGMTIPGGASGLTVNGSSIAQKLALTSGMNVGSRTHNVNGFPGPKWNAKTRREDDFPALCPAADPPPNQPIPNRSFLSKPLQSQQVGGGQRRPGAYVAEDFPSLAIDSGGRGKSSKTSIWSGGSNAKMKQEPKLKKVAPCPTLDNNNISNSSGAPDEFNYVPLSMSGRSSKIAAKQDLIEIVQEEDDIPKANAKSNKKKKSPNPVVLAADALFNSGNNSSQQQQSKSKKQMPSLEDDFPTLPEPKPKSRVTNKARVSPQKVITSPPARQIQPPPGFTLVKKADSESPESESIENFNSQTSPLPPPGFENVKPVKSNENFNIYGMSLDDEEEEYVPYKTSTKTYKLYIQPPEFSQRHQHLHQAIQSNLITDPDSFNLFSTVSGQFRKGEMSPKEYYEICQDMLGVSDFRILFRELITLLPDIGLQQELLVAHKKAGGKLDGLSICHECSQVLRSSDVSFHMKSHMESESFPTLNSGGRKK